MDNQNAISRGEALRRLAGLALGPSLLSSSLPAQEKGQTVATSSLD